jgi:hypothetical protein
MGLGKAKRRSLVFLRHSTLGRMKILRKTNSGSYETASPNGHKEKLALGEKI